MAQTTTDKLLELREKLINIQMIMDEFIDNNSQSIIAEYNNTHKNTKMTKVRFFDGSTIATITDNDGKIISSFAHPSETGWYYNGKYFD